MNKRSLKVIIIQGDDSERLAIKRTIGLCFDYLPNISECASLEEAEWLLEKKGGEPRIFDLIVLDCAMRPRSASFGLWLQQMKTRFGEKLLVYCHAPLDEFDRYTLRTKKVPFLERQDLTPDIFRARIEAL